ncbi:acylneuraminate cytidylyltransferase family protein [uncultured Clostridium sp.]|uniref:acylneuraminate cytidylyltransferase family protein n=1 Tax=uncultured Clostridium sp. TaxID=59620 RepID=UPI00263260F7|nr:acylneuraminate cytidylyltransferase family protein [uncultured Clostridium sp.]
MFKGKKILGIIPARSGSKELKDKNIKKLNNKHLIGYTVESAKRSGIFEKIIVSTDSKKYAKIAKGYGANIPFIRDVELSGDNVSTVDVILDCILKLEGMGEVYDYFILLQPTSPLRNEYDIVQAMELLISKKAKAVVSVCEVEHSSNLNIILDETKSMSGFMKDLKFVRRQDFKKEYRLNGAIYIASIEYYKKYKTFYEEDSFAYIMPKERSIDIDSLMDFKIAELYLE